MQSRLACILMVGVCITLFAACTSRAPTALFDDVSLDGWQSIGGAEWFVDDGSIVGTGSNGYLATEAVYDNYRLKLEFSVDAATNSGVFVQCQDREDISPLTCYEINIWDEHPRQEYRTGAIVTLESPLAKIDTLGRWNHYDIVVSDLKINVMLNGVLVSQLESPDKSSGFIALQRNTRGQARFRHLRLQHFAQ